MSFVNTPILRGFSEIEKLYNLISTHGGVICGGYARYCVSQQKKPEPAGDVDVFCRNIQVFENIRTALATLGFRIQHENDMALSYRARTGLEWLSCPRVQLIKPVIEGKIVAMGTVEEILENFDFTVVRAAIVNAHTAIVDKDFHEDDKKRNLHIKNIHCPLTSALRCMKYAKKGYRIRPVEVLKIFNDWVDRGPSYRRRLGTLLQQMDLSPKEVDELEALLRID